MSQEKNLIKIEDKKFWNKIISFFTNIFGSKKSEKNKELNENIENLTRLDKDNFLKKISLREDPELLKIQEKIENNEIEISTLSEVQIQNINALYERQIKILNDNYKIQTTELKMLQKQLNTSQE